MWRICRRGLAILAVVYVVYFLCTAFFPYLKKPSVSQEFRQEVETHSFYGGSPSVDRVVLVEDPRRSLDARIRMISEAENTLDIAYYGLHVGESSDLFLSAILDAADRGVKVRLLLDGGAGDLKSSKDLASAIGSHPNITLRLYNLPSLLKPWTINGRMHDKYIIVDNKLLLLGGRNIGDRFFGPDSYRKPLSIDRDVLVYNTAWAEDSRSSVLFSLRDYMDSVVADPHVRVVFSQPRSGTEAEAQRLRGLYAGLLKDHPQLFGTHIDWQEVTLPTNQVSLLSNPVGIGPKEPRVGFVLHKLLSEAEEGVLLQSPYVVLDQNVKDSMALLKEQGVTCKVLTNSMNATPNFPAFSLYLRDRQSLLDSGVRVFEFQNDDAIHAKTYLIDHRMSLVGSYNLDPRSEYIDTELLLAIDSPEFSQQLGRVVGLYLDHSLEMGPDGAYLPSDTLAPVQESGVKRAALNILGLLLTPFRPLV